MLWPMARLRLDRRTLLAAVPLALGLALVIGGFLAAQGSSDPARLDNPAIEQLYPDDGALVLRQSEVGVDLADGYTGELTIDGRALPTERVEALAGPVAGTVPPILVARFDPSVNTLLFQPREGAPLEEFDAGEHTIVLTYWPEVEGRQAAQQLSWSFRVT
jgi:hypothetical protein